MENNSEKLSWFEQPKNRSKVVILGSLATAVSLYASSKFEVAGIGRLSCIALAGIGATLSYTYVKAMIQEKRNGGSWGGDYGEGWSGDPIKPNNPGGLTLISEIEDYLKIQPVPQNQKIDNQELVSV